MISLFTGLLMLFTILCMGWTVVFGTLWFLNGFKSFFRQTAPLARVFLYLALVLGIVGWGTLALGIGMHLAHRLEYVP